MDAYEIHERARAVEREKAKLGRIDWYNRNVPVWWKNLKEIFADSVWEGRDLDEFCKKQFGCPEAEMRAFLQGAWRDLKFERPLGVSKSERKVPERLILESKESFRTGEKKAMTPAEKQRAYRERRKAGK